MSIVAALKGRGESGYGYGTTAREVLDGVDLSGRTLLITGSSSGLGLATSRELLRAGAAVIATARTEEKAREACRQAVSDGNGAASGMQERALPLPCELSDPASVRACVAAVRERGVELDGIVCNAGIMALPSLEQAFGYELQFFTNHIGHFMLVTGLLDSLSDRARVVVVSSDAHKAAPPEGIQFDNLSGERGYRGWTAYGQSKLANILFAKELSRRLEGTGKTANALHPGMIKTNLARNMAPIARFGLSVAEPLFLKSAEEGAATQCYVAAHPKVEGISGEYFADCNIARSSSISRNPTLAARLWDESEEIIERLPG